MGVGVQIVVVDRRPLLRRGLEALLPPVSGGRLRVVAGTHLAGAAAELVRRHAPDLVLVDLGLEHPGGVRAVAAALRVDPRTSVLAMAAGRAEDDDALAEEALTAGARGVLDPVLEPEELVTPLLAAAEGWAVLPPRLLRRMSAARSRPDGPGALLDAQQRRLWTLIADGAGTRRIAAELHVSDRTVKRLTATLLRRLGVASRTEAAALAGRQGLGAGPAGPAPAPGGRAPGHSQEGGERRRPST